MYSKEKTMSNMKNYYDQITDLAYRIQSADAILIGAGSGLSTADGFTYDGDRFQEHFSDFIEKYGFTDMYYAGFYSYPTPEEFWAFWSRCIFINRIDQEPGILYQTLYSLIRGKDYFILTTNVDHCFQRAGFDKHRLFYTQGDYGLWQCSLPCHNKTYDNEAAIRKMMKTQKEMRIPSSLIPRCPVCGRQMAMNLRIDDTFVEDEGWHQAKKGYQQFLKDHQDSNLLLLEIGVGNNTPGIIKYPFWQITAVHPQSYLASLNQEDHVVPDEIKSRTMLIKKDIKQVLTDLEKVEKQNEFYPQ